MPLWAMACIFFFRFFIVFYISELLVLQTNYVLNKQILQFLGLKPAIWIYIFLNLMEISTFFNCFNQSKPAHQLDKIL